MTVIDNFRILFHAWKCIHSTARMEKHKLLYGLSLFQVGTLFFVLNLHNVSNVLYRYFFESYFNVTGFVSSLYFKVRKLLQLFNNKTA
jgi:hypothetical protein